MIMIRSNLLKLQRFYSKMSAKTIGTHSGVFHADDAMGCMLLMNFTSEFKNGVITRSRDMSVLNAQDIVIDVGGVYDPSKHRYDHHQKGFNEVFNDKFDVKLSASGLVYKHFGKEILRNAAKHLIEEKKVPSYLEGKIEDSDINDFYYSIYKTFFVSLDAIDNGINQYPKDVKPKFELYRTDLASRVGRLNPNWWDESDDNVYDLNFVKAMDICREEFLDKLKGELMGSIASFIIVEKAFNDNSHLDNQVVVLDNSCYWKEAVYKLEEQRNLKGKVKYVVYPTSSKKEEYRIQAVPVSLSHFESRHPLKEEWRGLMQDELVTLTSIPDIVFCHHAGFIGGAKTIESVLKMAEISLNILKD